MEPNHKTNGPMSTRAEDHPDLRRNPPSDRFDSDRRRRLLSITNHAEPLVCRLLRSSYRRGSLVTISRFHGEVRLMHADSNLTVLATFLSCCFRIVANAVLPTQFLSNSGER